MGTHFIKRQDTRAVYGQPEFTSGLSAGELPISGSVGTYQR